MFELSQRFFFEAAHTLQRSIDAEGSRRIHGHTYDVDVIIRGNQDPVTGMVIDLGYVNRAIAVVREKLDHRFLDEEDAVMAFGPATVESLCRFIAHELRELRPAVHAIRIMRASAGDTCTYFVQPDA